MRTQPCPECNGNRTQTLPFTGIPLAWAGRTINCPTCEGEGTIPAEPVNHCPGCGEPVPLGQIWCERHKGAADILLDPYQ